MSNLPPESPDPDEAPQPIQPEIVIDPQEAAGRWANLAQVSFSDHEFTIDFIRMDPTQPRGIVVARVSGSALFIMQLHETLGRVWQNWASNALPKEVQGDEPAEGEGTGSGDPSPT